MKSVSIKYLSLALFSCILAANFDLQSMDQPPKFPSQLSLILPATLVYTLLSAGRRVIGYVSRSNSVPVDSTVNANPEIVNVSVAAPEVSPSLISEGIGKFFQDKYELGLKKGGELIEAFNNASPMKAAYFAWSHKGKIALTLGALALYKKLRENDKKGGNTYIRDSVFYVNGNKIHKIKK